MRSASANSNDSLNNVASMAAYQPQQGPEESWVDKVLQSMANSGIKKKLSCAARVHPCIIDGNRVLVYQQGLKQSAPDAFADLLEFATHNQFALKEDQRDKLSRGLPFERRRTRAAPMILLAGGLFLQGAAQAGAIPKNQIDDLVQKDHVFPMVRMLDEQNSRQRAYLLRDGKQFRTGVAGELENILAIAGRVKMHGNMTGVSTHNINMPGDYVGGFINRYDYRFADQQGAGQYSFYQGEGFGALGYYENGRVMMDILVGGDGTEVPVLGGPYDQILYDNHQMQLITYQTKQQTRISLLKASYSIGITAVISL